MESVKKSKRNRFEFILPMIFSKPTQFPEKSSGFGSERFQVQMCHICNKKFEAKSTLNDHKNLHPTKIIEGVFLGSVNNANNLNELNKLKIKYVLNVAHECKNTAFKGIKYKHLKMHDSNTCEIKKYVWDAFDFINEAISKNCNVLIHCQRGVSRSSAIIIAYLIKFKNMSVKDAFWFVKKKRSVAFPNFSFMEQLHQFQFDAL